MAPVTATFIIDSDTSVGEDIVVEIEGGEQVPLTFSSGRWRGSAKVETTKPVIQIQLLLKTRGSVNASGPVRKLDVPANTVAVEFRDTWKRKSGGDLGGIFNCGLFKDVIFTAETPANGTPIPRVTATSTPDSVVVRLNCSSSVSAPGKVVYCCGSIPALGAWKVENAVAMGFVPESKLWSLDLVVDKKDLPFSYKFILANEKRGEAQWEADPNRNFTPQMLDEFLANAKSAGLEAAMAGLSVSEGPAKMLSVTEEPIRIKGSISYKGAGLAVPVSALRSDSSLGVGEFQDLKLLVDFARASGFTIIQLLPVNDTTNFRDWRDSSPYSGISVFALHPMFINVPAIGDLPESLLADHAEQKKKLEAPTLKWQEVWTVKLRLLQEAFALKKAGLAADRDFARFVDASRKWLVPYAVFSCLRDKFDTCDYTVWRVENLDISRPSVELVERLAKEGLPSYFTADDVTFYYWVQYHLHRQLQDASSYAKTKRIGLKGDLPIGCSRFSVDTWMYPQYFDFDYSIGAPSDPGCFWGQNWGLPVYNWDNQAKDGFQWWKDRMSCMSQYFSAFRIDHVLGFFRTWSCPSTCVKGLMGHFSPANGIHRNELQQRGINDFGRLTFPYIRRQFVYDLFGGRGNEIIERFFDNDFGDRIKFKPHLATEAAIAKAFELPANANDGQKREAQYMKESLMGLLDSVVLIRDPHNGEMYHPRMRIGDSRSFQELPDHWKQPLVDLLNEYVWKRQDGVWTNQAMRLLPMLKGGSDMLPCAEDLGLIPNCLPGVMDRLGILGLRIQRFPTGPEEFAAPSQYPWLTVASTSTHDIAPLRAYWEQMDAGKRQRYFNFLGFNGNAPGFCEPWIVERIIFQHLESRSVICVLPLQDVLGLKEDVRRPGSPGDEQINYPDLGEHEINWRYRLHMPLEQLVKNKPFAEHVYGMLRSKGRTVF
eukprot:tig00000237_g20453.t1